MIKSSKEKSSPPSPARAFTRFVRLADTNGTVIWDSRCAYHAPTADCRGFRGDWRVLGIGEVSYLDAYSVFRAEELAMAGTDEKAGKGSRFLRGNFSVFAGGI